MQRRTRLRKIRRRDAAQRGTERAQGVKHAHRIVGRRLDLDVEIPRLSRLGVKGDGVRAYEEVIKLASLNAANRSLKSRFTIRSALQDARLENHVPHQCQSFLRGDRLPEFPVERAVVWTSQQAGTTLHALVTTIRE